MRLLAFLVVLGVVAVGADFALKAYAESEMEARLTSSLALHEAPSVDIEGFPFLMQVLEGRIASVRVEATGVERDGIELEQVRLELDGVEASLQTLLEGQGKVEVERGSGRASISEAALNEALREEGYEVSAELAGGGLTVGGYPGAPAASVTATTDVVGDLLVIRPPEGAPPLELPLPDLVGGMAYAAARIAGSQLVLTFELRDAELRVP